MNAALQLVSNQMRGVRVDVRQIAPAADEAGRTALIQTMFAGDVSEATTKTLARAETPQQMIALALGSPEFRSGRATACRGRTARATAVPNA